MIYRFGLERAIGFCVLLGATATCLAGCETADDLKASAHVSPFIGRSAPADTESNDASHEQSDDDQARAGSGGYLIGRDAPSVKDLRVRDPKPVNLDTLRLPDNALAATRGNGRNGGQPSRTHGNSGQPDCDTAYCLAAGDPQMRNRLQNYLLRISDEVCIGHKSDIIAVSSGWNFALSGMSSLFGHLGSIVGGTVAKSALSGAAGFSNDLRDDFNQNLYYSNVATAIVKQIDLQRAAKLQEIIPKQSQKIDGYTVDAAIGDVVEYHNRCSFSEGLAALANESKRPATADEVKARLDALRAEFTKNQALIDSKSRSVQGSTHDALVATNAAIAEAMRSLAIQLSMAEGAPAQVAPAADAPTTPAPAAGGTPTAGAKGKSPK